MEASEAMDDTSAAFDALNITSESLRSPTVDETDHDLYPVLQEGDYKYQPLDPTKNEIRLLKIFPKRRVEGIRQPTECSLSNASLDNLPVYKALSYTWSGDFVHNPPIVNIRLDGHNFSVTPNLGEALYHLQSETRTKIFWIDAICIDQSNVEERSEQVQHMRRIYQQAEEVVVWLGAATEAAELAFDFFHRVYQVRDDHDSVETILNDPHNVASLEGVSDLLRRDYWYRIWVVQEVNLNENNVILCGKASMLWRQLKTVQDILRDDHWNIIHDKSMTESKLSRLSSAINANGCRQLDASRWNRVPSEAPDLYSLLSLFSIQTSTDPRDKIYAIVGLSASWNDPRLPIDYSKSLQEVYTDLVKYLLPANQNLDIIIAMPSGEYKNMLPSWVPDWTAVSWKFGYSAMHIDRYRQEDSVPTFCAAESSAHQASVKECDKVLVAKGFKLDSINVVAKKCPMTAYDSKTWQESIPVLLDWLRTYGRTTGFKIDQFFCFCRTIMMDREPGFEENKEGKTGSILAAIWDQRAESFPEEEIEPELVSLMELTHMERSKAKVWAINILNWAACRRFFITSSNNIGMAPNAAESGDIICILLGCSWPVVLRRVDDYYILIGAAYVDGYMFGKAMEELEEGKFELEDFEIH